MSPGEIVARVYSAFEPAPLWDEDRLRGLNTECLPRLYCPACRHHGSIMRGDMFDPPRRNPENNNKHASQQSHWFCALCKTWHRRPLALRARGEVTGVESRSPKDKDWRIVDGIEAGKVMSAVESLPVGARCWALWAHTHTGTAAMQNTIVEHALLALDGRGIDRPATFREGRAALVLSILVSEDSRQRARNGNTLHSAASFAAAIGVDSSQMVASRRWGKLRNSLSSVFDEFELAMGHVVVEAIHSRLVETA